MQANRLRQAEQSLSGIAKRVLEAIPISEPWTVGQICTELMRTGSRVDMNIVMGCLRTHVGQGLCKEPRQLSFQRVHIPETEQPPIPAPPLRVVHPQPEKNMAATAKTPAPAPSGDSLGQIGSLAARLREQGRALIVWAEELERIGLEFEGRVDAAKQGNAKLHALQALLKSISE